MFDLTSKYPMAHRISIPRPYVPSFSTDIRKTFAREWHRLAREAFARELHLHAVHGHIEMQKHYSL